MTEAGTPAWTASLGVAGDRHDVPAALILRDRIGSTRDSDTGHGGSDSGDDRMFDTVALSFLVACAIVVLGIPAALLEVYYFRIRKRRQRGRKWH